MKIYNISLAIAVACLANLATAQTAEFFAPNEIWKSAAEVSITPASNEFEVTTSDQSDILYTQETPADEDGYLTTKGYFSDQIVSFEYMVTPGSDAGVYLQGRYEVKLSADNAGTLAGGFNNNKGQAFKEQPPLVGASNPAGEWNSITIRFRTLRNDDAFNKISNSLFLDITINNKIVQSDAQIEYYTDGSILQWEQSDGPLAFRAANGPLAIRNFHIDHANYDAVIVPEFGQPSNFRDLVDQVEIGKETFTAMGCIECHTVTAGDTSFKTGPNLHGLFQRTPRKREIFEPASEARFSVDADLSYAKRSIRVPAAELSIRESGPNTGEAYLPIMVPYSEEILSNAKVDALYRYLATLNVDANRAAIEYLVTKDGPAEYNVLEDATEILVLDRTRIQRGSMAGLSGRSIHVGQPNGVNYSFDPRTLAIERLWQGGFLNASGEWENRGGGGFTPGYESKEFDLTDAGGLLAPLNADGKGIDFSFKEAIFRDWDTINDSLYNSKDHLELLAEIDAQFLGYTLDSTRPDATPVFHYRIGQNRISIQTSIAANGETQIHLTGSLVTEQAFALNTSALKSPTVSNGTLQTDGNWKLPASKTLDATLTGKLGIASIVWRPEPTDAEHLVQPLITEPTNAKLPAGYSSEQFIAPHDNYGRDLLFEATGIAVAPDGTIIVGTRTAGIWRIVDGHWNLFAEGLFDCLGLVVEDESGLSIVAGQKPELTQITDTDGDGIADTYTTLSDQFSYHSNYHAYMHGPVRDAEGNYYYTLNLLHADDAIFKSRGLYMGTSGGYRGWTIKVTPEGEFIPYADGLRSPASLGVDPQNQLWFADNQGEYVSTSKLFMLNEGEFYGHPSGLVDRPGMTPDSPEIQWPAIGEKKQRAVALFPHNKVANSPGNMAWDTTGGSFGPYSGQMFIGDQTQSNLLRVATYQINGTTRAAVMPFGEDLQSGVMRPVFLPDGSLLIGQTGRGWHAHGGKVASLQRISWDGKTAHQDIHTAALSDDALEISVTLVQAISETVATEQLQAGTKIVSWAYRDAPEYGSPELDEVTHVIANTTLSEDRKLLTLTLEPSELATQVFQTARVYHLTLSTLDDLQAYITGE